MRANRKPTALTRRSAGFFSLKGCGLFLLSLVLLVAAGIGYFKVKGWNRDRVLAKAQEEKAKVFDKVISLWTDKASIGPGTPEAPAYDIDKTIRVMHEMDLAMKERTNFQDFLNYALSIDPRGVDAEVLKARAQTLALLKEMYVRQRELDDSDDLWLYSSEFFLGVLDTFKVDLSPVGLGFGFDDAKAKSTVASVRERHEARDRVKREIFDQEWKLFEVVSAYANTYYARMEEWDRLCVLRDRAYLAAAEGNWGVAEQASRAAIRAAPYEREAHILLAQALIEQGGEPRMIEAEALLNTYIEVNPDANAPALLLLGVMQRELGRIDDARLNLQQAAAYYPRQAAKLADMLDPYRMRAFLRKTREGNAILQGYKSTMLGAGYFSPDLQLAALNYGQEMDSEAETKVFDHFFRRRTQQQWDFILSDIDFCYDYLGTAFYLIYPEDSYLDLVAKPGYRNKMYVSIQNRSDRTLHNASLILCLHFTDMIPGDYYTMTVGRTLPALMPNETTEFDAITINEDLLGMKKTPADIVSVRAILVSQEAVVWVDTPEYNLAESKEFRDLRLAGKEQEALDVDWLETIRTNPEALRSSLLKDVSAQVIDNRFSKDSLGVQLPRELALLRPFFQLMVDGETLTPAENTLEGDHINLRFDKLPSKLSDVNLSMIGAFADMALKLRRNASGGYEVESIKPEAK